MADYDWKAAEARAERALTRGEDNAAEWLLAVRAGLALQAQLDARKAQEARPPLPSTPSPLFTRATP